MERFTMYPCTSLVLDNSGTVAQDHLESERTFLGYVCTSMTMVWAAVVLTQLLCVLERLRSQVLAPLESFDLYARPLVVVSIILAGFTLGIGVWRYFTVQTALMKGTFPVTRFGPAFIALALGVIIGAIFMLLLASDE